MIDADVGQKLKEEFSHLVSPVRLAVFSQALADPESEQVRRLVEEVGSFDPKVKVESYNFVLDKDRVEALGISRIPAIAILGEEKDYGIRMYGAPSGYEFGTLIEGILDVSRGESGLAPETRTALGAVSKDVRIQVFSTPT
ncbi:MAG TPA: glutaredoxin, partial [Vicinamibacteria bacterium]|jgi:alkyl hydroperoxide reductase subunit AhpF|nr:glutaredoxin [Vicinamibacteria bacterium]